MCFDTTAANTEHRVGACILIEQKMKKDLLWLACRHHMIEIILQAVFELLFGTSYGPDVGIFKRFENQWNFIDKSNFLTFSSDPALSERISVDETIEFLLKQMQLFQPIDDYKELLQLTLVLIFYEPPHNFTFKRSVGLHPARWMAKLIYSMKTWMFRNQFELTEKENTALKEICVYGVRVYVKAWVTAPAASSAPRNDLELMKNIFEYQRSNKAASDAAMMKVQKHMWYLSEELIALSFFDDGAPSETN